MLDDYWADDLLSVRWTRWSWVWWWWFSVYRGPPLSSKGMLRLRTSLAVGTLALGPSSFISPHLPLSPPSFHHAHTNTHAHLPSDLLELAARRAPAPMICHMIVGFDFSRITSFSITRSLNGHYALQETFNLSVHTIVYKRSKLEPIQLHRAAHKSSLTCYHPPSFIPTFLLTVSKYSMATVIFKATIVLPSTVDDDDGCCDDVDTSPGWCLFATQSLSSSGPSLSTPVNQPSPGNIPNPTGSESTTEEMRSRKSLVRYFFALIVRYNTQRFLIQMAASGK